MDRATTEKYLRVHELARRDERYQALLEEYALLDGPVRGLFARLSTCRNMDF